MFQGFSETNIDKAIDTLEDIYIYIYDIYINVIYTLYIAIIETKWLCSCWPFLSRFSNPVYHVRLLFRPALLHRSHISGAISVDSPLLHGAFQACSSHDHVSVLNFVINLRQIAPVDTRAGRSTKQLVRFYFFCTYLVCDIFSKSKLHHGEIQASTLQIAAFDVRCLTGNHRGGATGHVDSKLSVRPIIAALIDSHHYYCVKINEKIWTRKSPHILRIITTGPRMCCGGAVTLRDTA